MAYTYQVEFDIQEEQMVQLRIGARMEKVIGYLRTMLPGEPGFIFSQGLCSVNRPGSTRVVIQSAWELWEELLQHQASGMAEQKVLAEFGPHITIEDLVVTIYKEVP